MGSSYNKSGGDRNALKLVKGKPTGKRLLGRLRRRWEDNIRNRYQYKELG